MGEDGAGIGEHASALRTPRSRRPWLYPLYREWYDIIYRLFLAPNIARLPAPVAYGLAVAYADVRMRISGRIRRQIALNLRKTIGSGLDPAQLRAVTRGVFRDQSCMMMDEALLQVHPSRLFRLISVKGRERIAEALEKGKGVVVCGAHFGSFRVVMSYFSSTGLPLTAIARWSSVADTKPLGRRGFLDRRLMLPITRNFRSPNIVVQTDGFSKGEFGGAVRASKVLRSNESLWSQLDAVPNPKDLPRTVTVEFLNGKARFMPGAVTLARTYGSGVFVVLARREPDWRHQVFEVSPQISMEGSEADAYQRCIGVLDRAIRRSPAQWQFWVDERPSRLGLFGDPPSPA